MPGPVGPEHKFYITNTFKLKFISQDIGGKCEISTSHIPSTKWVLILLIYYVALAFKKVKCTQAAFFRGQSLLLYV